MTSAEPTTGRRLLGAALAGALVCGALGALLAPAPATIGPESTGDPVLAERLRALAGDDGAHGLVASVTGDGTTVTAGVGDDGRGTPLDASTPFEIGSVTKTVTGAVLADLELGGVVRGTDRVRDVLPQRPWGPVGDVTLAELASHRSGLPVDAGGAPLLLHNMANGFVGTPPVERTPEEVFAAADGATLGPRGEDVYSNLGFALLGQVLAERTGTPYPQLVEQVVTGPLGMASTGLPGAPPTGAAIGHDLRDRPLHPWISAGDAPAGIGVWSTVDDLVRYVGALDDPGSVVSAAAQPRFPSDLGRIGYGWETLEEDGRTFLWKNGGSGGIRTSVLVEPAADRAVVVFGNADRGVDRIAVGLLDAPALFGDDSDGPGLVGWIQILLATVFPVYAGISVLVAARGGWWATGPFRRPELVGAAGWALFFLVLSWARGDVAWALLPFWVLGCALAGAGLGIATVRWREAVPAPRAWWSAALGVLVGAGALVAVVVSAALV
ncbi:MULTISPECIES: serine hydrolase domain-containing protein [unclassified Pseudonocardia]|uniref:serine hydrolase domain-containing protein n=1 Tax=unclassified Pseudonocardia TaxID=2619320 RepID=UPI0007612239|nr:MULTISPECIES: serine hydrolase domain-containing protein [unclassified Pseudonocardia]